MKAVRILASILLASFWLLPQTQQVNAACTFCPAQIYADFSITDIKAVPISAEDGMAAGHQYTLQISFTNWKQNQTKEIDPVIILVEVADSNNSATLVGWHSQLLAANEKEIVGMSWTPEHAGNYTLWVRAGTNLAAPPSFLSSDIAVH